MLEPCPLVAPVTFSTPHFGDATKPGVQAMISNIAANAVGAISPERMVGACLDQMGAISVSEDSRRVLIDFASMGGDVTLGAAIPGEQARRQIAAVLQMVASTQEFQRS